MSDVALWRKAVGLERYADAFAANEIDFATFPELTEEDLEELGLPIGQRCRVLNGILALRPDPSAPGERMATEPSSISKATAARRQVTAAFCDLVGSTELTAKSDAAREIITARASSKWSSASTGSSPSTSAMACSSTLDTPRLLWIPPGP